MCGFTITNKDISTNRLDNRFVSLRGPDKTTLSEYKNFKFCHHLLSITGQFIEQPFIDHDDEIATLYNGEIYNYKKLSTNFQSDGECIIPFYKRHEEYFTKKLDGEFALVLIDYKKEIVVISSDLFRTKPIFYSIDDGKISASSYHNALLNLECKNIEELAPNTTLIFDFNGVLKYKFNIYAFDINNQNKTSMNDWVEAFDLSIEKRASTTKGLFIGLSSGYDSGAICCSLLKQNKKFKTFSVIGNENNDILNERFAILSKNKIDHEIIIKTPQEYNKAHSYIEQNTDEFRYSIRNKDYSYTEFIRLIDDGGSNWLSSVCDRAKQQNYKVILSGMGADEIISDYGFDGNKHFAHSNFGGKFPEDLSTIFPWPSFYDSTMRSYINKEEYVGGSYGIETRYPFLDKMVVQQFLWLHPSVKNSCYKSVISYYLENNNFPFEKGVKRGF